MAYIALMLANMAGKRWVTSVALAVIFGLALLTGCSNQSEGSGGLPASESVPVVDSASTITSGDVEFVTMYDLLVAEQGRIESCMTQQGFVFFGKEINPRRAADPLLNGSDDYQLTDYELQLSQASEFGYGGLYDLLSDTDESRTQRTDPNIAIVNALSEQEARARAAALYGDENGGGCITEASEWRLNIQLLDHTPDEFERLEQAEIAAFDAMDADVRIVDAEAGWQTCMTLRGYQLDPGDEIGATFLQRATEILGFSELSSETSEDELRAALTDVETRADLVELFDQERAMATADVECNEPLILLQNEIYSSFLSAALEG